MSIPTALKVLSPATAIASKKAGRKAVSPLYGVISSMKKGGKVRKTGKYRLHKGERVLNRRQARRYNGGKR